MGHEFVEMKNTPAAIDAYRRAVGKRDRFDCPHYMQQFLDWNVIPRFVALILLPFLRCSSVPSRLPRHVGPVVYAFLSDPEKRHTSNIHLNISATDHPRANGLQFASKVLESSLFFGLCKVVKGNWKPFTVALWFMPAL